MSKKGLLNPQFNRVRTSNALKSNDMWEKMIGVTEERGTNEAIEASIRAPTRGGADKEERRQRAQALIDASGYKPVVTDYKGLMSLARAQGGIGNTTRGACKLCGGLGHRTKQCTNFLSGHSGGGDVDVVNPAGPSAVGVLGLLPDPSEDEGSDLNLSDLESGSSSSSSGSDSDSDSSDGESRKRKRSSSSKDRKSKKKHKKDSRKSEKKSKKRSKEKKEKKRKEKKSRH